MIANPYIKSMRRRSGGFTLIEAVITIVITGILSGMVAVFIAGPVKGYIDSARRAELTDNADLVLRRLSREVRLSLPNSVRVTSSGGFWYIEFIETSGGGRFRDRYSDQSTSAGTNSLNFNDGIDPATGSPTATAPCATTPGNCMFDVVGPMPINPSIASGDFIVVWNQGQNVPGVANPPADAYATGNICSNCNRAQVAAAPAGQTVTLTPDASGLNVFAHQSVQTRSSSDSSNRFHVVPGGVRAITYACPTATGTLTRYVNYGFYTTPALAIAALANPTVMATRASCTVSYDTAQQRNGLLTVKLTLRDYTNTTNIVQENVTLLREIHVDNSP